MFYVSGFKAERHFFICLGELPGIRRQLKLSKVVVEKLNEVQLKPYSTSIFENEIFSDGAETKIRNGKRKRTEKENMQSDLILCDREKSSASNFKSENHSSITYSNIQSNKTIIEGADTNIISDEQKRTEKENMELEKTRVLSEPEKSLTSNLKSGSTTINSNIQSDVFRDREKKRLRMEGTGFSTDQENRSDRLCNSKREIKPGNSQNPLKCANMFNPIASVIENIKETGVEKQLNSDIRISNPKTLSGSHKQDLPSRLGGKDSTNIVKIRNASNSIARTIYSDKNQPKEKKIVRSESFCFLDIEDGSHHQNKATKAVMKGLPLYFPKRFPSLVKSKICSDKKKQKKQLSSRSTKYSSDKESSSKHLFIYL